ncbi:MAG: hypothetical protein ACLQPV_11760 [Vulcanimicrobiaceae bacterium]
MRRLDPLEERRDVWIGAPGENRAEAVTIPAVADAGFDAPALPHGHPEWVRDALSVSQRARSLMARLRPAVIRAFTFWDHRLRCILVGSRRVSVDASGSYRVE